MIYSIQMMRGHGDAWFQRLRWVVPVLGLLLTGLACRAGGAPALVFAPDQLPDASVGQVFISTISVAQNVTPVSQMTVAAGDLPPGLQLAFNKSQGLAVLGGTPQHAGTYKFTISAWCFGTNNTGQSGHHDYQLVVNAAASP